MHSNSMIDLTSSYMVDFFRCENLNLLLFRYISFDISKLAFEKKVFVANILFFSFVNCNEYRPLGTIFSKSVKMQLDICAQHIGHPIVRERPSSIFSIVARFFG